MKKINVMSKTAFVFKTKTNLHNINDVVMQWMPKLEKEAAELNLEIIEPSTFVYHGATADMEKQFDLEIALIVKETVPYEGQFEFTSLNELTVASFTYQGSMEHMYAFYEKIYPEIMASGVQPLTETREVYHVYEGFDSPKNVTEIQIAIQEPQLA